MKASSGSESLLSQPTASAEAPEQTLSVAVRENEAIVARATDGRATTEYWVRCLPRDFPHLRWARHPDAGVAPAGYYLVGNYEETTTGGYALVLDGEGVPVWYAAVPRGHGALDVDAVIHGTISFAPYEMGTPAGAFFIHQLSPPKTMELAPSGTRLNGHELQVLPNGDYVAFSYPLRSGFDLTGLSISLPDGGVESLGPNSSILDCDVVEFDPTGNVVWTWRGTDHFDPARDSTYPQPGPQRSTGSDAGATFDVFHCNSIDVDRANGNLLISSRYMDSIFYVERSTGTVLWKMGGARFTKEHATYIPVPDPFFRQHDARLQPGWSSACADGGGQVSLFDDQTAKPGAARGIVYDVKVSTAGGACDGGTAPAATTAWQFKEMGTSLSAGSFRISADGSRIIGWGDSFVPGHVFTEVDVHGVDLLDFYFTDDGSISYRAVKVPLTTFDLRTLRATAGLP